VRADQLIYHQGMWRAEVGGKHYCAQTKELLKLGLKHVGISVSEPQYIEFDDRTPTEVYIDVLRSPESPLLVKQETLIRLFTLANQGDPLAEELVNAIPTDRSFDAQYYTKQIGKTDFLFVGVAELHEYVDNIVLRSKLITELGNLYKRI
jgi:hypothetical protein